MPYVKPLRAVIAGIDVEVGTVISVDEWARWAQIPRNSGDGVIDGAVVERVLGVVAKSWEPARFRDLDVPGCCARTAMRSAGVGPQDIDTVLLVTCTPHQTMLDQDAMRLLRELGIADDVVPVQLSAGCAGLARAAALLATQTFTNALVITYTLASALVTDDTGGLNEHYRSNDTHPFGKLLWTSPALFSDAAAALVLRHEPSVEGFAFYSRDSLAFGDEPGYRDPLIHYLGGGAARPPGVAGASELSCYGMNGPEIKRYYGEGMRLNHRDLQQALPGYADAVDRIYIHQASPALVGDFLRQTDLPLGKIPTLARQLGNLVSASTPKLLFDDVTDSDFRRGLACFSLVGAGPERGAFVLPVDIESPVTGHRAARMRHEGAAVSAP